MKPDNEGQLKKENLDLFSHINSEFVHKYMRFLFKSGSGIAPHVLITYIQTLTNEQQTNAMTVIIEFFNVRSINTFEILIDHEFKNESLQVFVNDVKKKEVEKIWKAGEYKIAFEMLLKAKEND